jgi:hypothetical protein
MSSPQGELPDALLVERCLAGASDAWAEFLCRFRGPLLRTIRLGLGPWGRDNDRVEEILSGLWEALVVDDYRRLRACDRSRPSLGTYLATLARRLGRQHRRALARHPVEHLAERSHKVVAHAPFPWAADAVPEGYVALLTPRERDYLRRFLLAPPGAAGAWPFSRAYAAQLERRLREKLRRYLAERGGEELVG